MVDSLNLDHIIISEYDLHHHEKLLAWGLKGEKNQLSTF